MNRINSLVPIGLELDGCSGVSRHYFQHGAESNSADVAGNTKVERQEPLRVHLNKVSRALQATAGLATRQLSRDHASGNTLPRLIATTSRNKPPSGTANIMQNCMGRTLFFDVIRRASVCSLGCDGCIIQRDFRT